MSKLIAGFVLGVIVTISVVILLDNNPLQTQEIPTSQSVLPEEVAELERSILANKIAEAADEDREESDISTSADPVLNTVPLALQAESIGAPQPDTRTTSPAPTSSAKTTNDDYPPEIAEMIENSVDKELQERYESDEREESWAQYMEGQLTAYFAQKPELAQFSFSLIDCRTSICEIHVIGYGPDALALWNVGIADITTQTWHDFGSMSSNQSNPQPDILAIVLILTRKPPG